MIILSFYLFHFHLLNYYSIFSTVLCLNYTKHIFQRLFLFVFGLFCFLKHFVFSVFCLCSHKNALPALLKNKTASDGRLYRCEVTPGLSNGSTLSRTDDSKATEDEDDYDDDNWKEQEASRTHSVKFSDSQDTENREVSQEPNSTGFGTIATGFRSIGTDLVRLTTILVDRTKDWATRWWCFDCFTQRTAQLNRTNSYFMLNALRELDEIYSRQNHRDSL